MYVNRKFYITFLSLISRISLLVDLHLAMSNAYKIHNPQTSITSSGIPSHLQKANVPLNHSETHREDQEMCNNILNIQVGGWRSAINAKCGKSPHIGEQKTCVYQSVYLDSTLLIKCLSSEENINNKL